MTEQKTPWMIRSPDEATKARFMAALYRRKAEDPTLTVAKFMIEVINRGLDQIEDRKEGR